MYRFKFTVIMAVRGDNEYLEQTINSVIHQNAGFEKNIQFIMSLSGVSEECEQLCREYQENYPENIVILQTKSETDAAAWNEALRYREGRYINFIAPGDKLTANALNEVYSFFAYYSPSIDIVVIPVCDFGAVRGIEPEYAEMGRANGIKNLLSFPHLLNLSASASFYKTQIFDTELFDETRTDDCAAEFNIRIQKTRPMFGFVGAKRVKSYHRVLSDGVSSAATFPTGDEALNALSILDSAVFAGDHDRELTSYEKETVIYFCRKYLFMSDKIVFSSDEQKEEFLSVIRRYLKGVDTEFILTRSKYADRLNLIIALLELKGDSFANQLASRRYLNTMRLSISVTECVVKNDTAFFEVKYFNYGYDAHPYIVDQNNFYYAAFEDREVDCSLNSTYGMMKLDNVHICRFAVRVNTVAPIVLRFVMRDGVNNCYTNLRAIGTSQRGRFTSRDKNIGVYFDNYVVYFSGFNFKIVPRRKALDYNDYVERSYRCILKDFRRNAFFRLFAQEEKKYILINDRPMKAGDNGEALFRYIRDNVPELRDYTYFVIRKNSSDYERMKPDGHVVALGSSEHKKLFINARFIFSPHLIFEYYNPFTREEYRFFADLCSAKLVWLQHGVIMNDVFRGCNRLAVQFDYYVCSVLGEYNMMSSDPYFYKRDQLLLTGLPRYDILRDESENVITIAPTWRRTLTGQLLPDGTHAPIDNIRETDYYRQFENVLTNERFLDMLRRTGMRCEFFLHPEMLCYSDEFKEFENDVVTVLDASEICYNKVFAKSKLFISDYSSTTVDFAYLFKPLIYFQFDRDEFFKDQYLPGWFEYRSKGFGDVIETADGLIDKIMFYCNNGFKIEQKYDERIRNTFKFHDKNNSRRLLDATVFAHNGIPGDYDDRYDSFIPEEYIGAEKTDMGENIVFLTDISLPGDSENIFNHKTVVRRLENGGVYEFTSGKGSVISSEGELCDVYEVAVFDKDAGDVYASAAFVCGCERTQKFDFTVPAAGNYELCVYAGLRRHTENKSLELSGAKLVMTASYEIKCSGALSEEIAVPDAEAINAKFAAYPDDDNYKNICLCKSLETGKLYEFSVSDVKLLSGGAKTCELRAFGDGADMRMKILTDKAEQTFKFFIPQNASDIKLYFYSGEFADTSGTLISVGGVSLKKSI